MRVKETPPNMLYSFKFVHKDTLTNYYYFPTIHSLELIRVHNFSELFTHPIDKDDKQKKKRKHLLALYSKSTAQHSTAIGNDNKK